MKEKVKKQQTLIKYKFLFFFIKIIYSFKKYSNLEKIVFN